MGPGDKALLLIFLALLAGLVWGLTPAPSQALIVGSVFGLCSPLLLMVGVALTILVLVIARKSLH